MDFTQLTQNCRGGRVFVQNAFKKAILVAILCAAAIPMSASDSALEYKVKAFCVMNAARFVGWPPSTFGAPNEPVVIGIVGENPFDSLLEQAVRGETVQQRRITVRRVALREAADCHIVFIARSEKDRLAAILSTLGHQNVLTISDIDRFAAQGGVIGLTLENGKVRFEISPQAAQRASLKIDSRLLSLARIVK